MSPSNVAVLFFTRSAKTEGTSKQFTNNHCKGQNTRIAHSLIDHTHNQLSRTGLPVFIIDEKLQEGCSFGERLTNAFNRVFNHGFDHVIAVGNDTPQLKAHHIKEAGHHLSSDIADIVLGPASDGGTWLMGYSREAFEGQSFEELPWNSSRLLESILKQLGNNFCISLLEEFADIDDYSSLEAFIESLSFDASLLGLKHSIRAILTSPTSRLIETGLLFFPDSVYTANLLRAPPLTV